MNLVIILAQGGKCWNMEKCFWKQQKCVLIDSDTENIASNSHSSNISQESLAILQLVLNFPPKSINSDFPISDFVKSFTSSTSGEESKFTFQELQCVIFNLCRKFVANHEPSWVLLVL